MRATAFAATILAVAPVVIAKSVLITFKDGADESVIEEAKTKYEEAGGRITHEFHLIDGFAADIPDEGLDEVSAWGDKHNMLVEDDKGMGTQ